MRRRTRLAVLLAILVAIAVWWLARGGAAPEPRAPSVAAGRVAPRAARTAPPAAAEQEFSPAAAALPAAAPGHVQIEVRDLADGSPVPGMAVRFAGLASETSLASDGEGRIEVPAQDVSVAQFAVDAPFRAVGTTPACGSQAPAALWVCRDLDVSVTVRTQDVTLGKVNLHWYVAAGAPGRPPSMEPPPWSTEWLRAHRVGARVRIGRVKPGETLRCKVPRIRGIAVVASDPERQARPDIRRLEVRAHATSAEAEMLLVPGAAVAGRVLSDGPLPPGLRVDVYVGRKEPFADIDISRLHLCDQGVTVGGKVVPGALVDLVLITRASVRPDGTFRVPVHEHGDAMVEMAVPGRALERVPLGALDGGRSDVVLRLRDPGPLRELRLLCDGRPLTVGSVLFTDGSAEVGQPAYGPFPLGAEGAIDARFLLGGHAYYANALGAERGARGWFTWQGQATLDLVRDLRKDKNQ